MIEEDDDGEWGAPATHAPVAIVVEEVDADPFEPLLDRLLAGPSGVAQSPAGNGLEDRREAAELLHGLGTAEALRRLGSRPRHAYARALLRDTRWDVPGAGPVPILGEPGWSAVAGELVRLRLRSAAGLASARLVGASIGGGMAGAFAGLVGGLMLAAVPGGTASLAVAPVLAFIGGCCGAAGGAGVGAGLSLSESVFRSRRALALVGGAAFGGGTAGLLAQLLGGWSLTALVGITVGVGGLIEGLVIGAGAGLGYSLGTAGTEGGLAAPRGRRRITAAAVTAAICGVAALALTLSGRPLVGGTIHAIAAASRGSQVTLTPIARLVGEPDFGPLTASLIGTGEGAVFGLGLALGLTRRQRV